MSRGQAVTNIPAVLIAAAAAWLAVGGLCIGYVAAKLWKVGRR